MNQIIQYDCQCYDEHALLTSTNLITKTPSQTPPAWKIKI